MMVDSARLEDGNSVRRSGSGNLTVVGATIGLTFGPSTILVFALGSFVAPLQASFGWSKPEIMLAATIVSLMIVVVSPLQGWLIDRYGTRPVMLWSASFFAVGICLLSALPNRLWVFYLAYTILPVVAVGLWPVGYLRAVATWFTRRLGLALGITNSGIGIGAALLPLLATWIMTHGGNWRTALLTFGIIVALTVPLNAFLLHEAPVRANVPDRSNIGRDGGGLREAWRNPVFPVLLLAYFCVGFVNTGIIVNQISLLIDTGNSPERAAFIQSFFGISIIAGRLLLGALLDYVRASSIMIVGCLCAAGACALYAFSTAGTLPFLSAGLLGLLLGAEFDVAAYLTKRFFGVKAFGKIYGLLYALFQLAAAIGTPVLALSRSIYASYEPGLMLYGLLLLTAAICFLRIDRHERTMPSVGRGRNT